MGGKFKDSEMYDITKQILNSPKIHKQTIKDIKETKYTEISTYAILNKETPWEERRKFIIDWMQMLWFYSIKLMSLSLLVDEHDGFYSGQNVYTTLNFLSRIVEEFFGICFNLEISTYRDIMLDKKNKQYLHKDILENRINRISEEEFYLSLEEAVSRARTISNELR